MESDRTVFVAVTLEQPATEDVIVSFATGQTGVGPGHATENEDYIAQSGTVVIKEGQDSTQIAIPIVPDMREEDPPTETFLVQLLDVQPSGYEIIFGTATVTIVDGESTTAPEIRVVKGSAGVMEVPDGANVDFGTAQLNQAIDIPFTVYNDGTGLLHLAQIYPDLGSPYFTVLSNIPYPTSLVPGGSQQFIIRFYPTAAGNFSGSLAFGNNDADENPFNILLHGVGQTLPGVSIGNAPAVIEGNQAVFTLQLTHQIAVPVSVQFSTQDFTAVSNGFCLDYYANVGTVVFPANQTQRTITVHTVPDVYTEPDEEFYVNLSNPVGATVVDGQGMGRILANTGADNGLQILVTGTDWGTSAEIKVFDGASGTHVVQTVEPYTAAFTGGVRVATADINGDGYADVITAAGTDGGPHVRAYNGAPDGSGQYAFPALSIPGYGIGGFFAYGGSFTGGVFVASGDVNGDGYDDIITGADAGGSPHVRVFSGATGGVIWDLFPYDVYFPGGVRVACADVNGDGYDDVITSPGAGGGPHVRVFSGATHLSIRELFAYSGASTGGLYVSTGDLDGDGCSDIVVGEGPVNTPTEDDVKAFSGATLALITSMNPYPGFTGGVRVAVGDVVGNGQAYILTAAGPSGGAHIRSYTSTGIPYCSFFAYTGTYNFGNHIAAVPPLPPVTEVTYVPAGVGSSTTGDLTEDNPNGNPADPNRTAPAFRGGWRFFPDAANDITFNVSRNVVMVKATVGKPNQLVHFASFDVDDPSSNPNIDINDGAGPKGDDNNGTFAPGSTTYSAPGVSSNSAGYHGVLRRRGTTNWHAELTTVTAMTDAAGDAYVELATSFAPGDNFRVVATTDIRALVRMLNDAILRNVLPPTTGDVGLAGGQAADQLSVWRRLHVERDRMTNGAVLGDQFTANVAGAVVPDAPGYFRFDLTPTGLPSGEDGAINANELEGGFLRQPGGPGYFIVSNTQYTGGPITVVIQARTDNPNNPNFPFGAQLEVYEDDFAPDWVEPPTSPTKRVNPASDNVEAAMYQFMQGGAINGVNRKKNRFADAYIEPAYDLESSQYKSLITAVNHINETQINDPTVLGGRGSTAVESQLFWTVYVTSAFQEKKGNDADYDSWRLHLPSANVAESPSPGGWTSTTHVQSSFVFVETIFDLWQAANHWGTTQAVDYFEQLGRTTVHEVGHQFQIATGEGSEGGHRDGTNNIMMTSTSNAPLLQFYFHGIDIRAMRKRDLSP